MPAEFVRRSDTRLLELLSLHRFASRAEACAKQKFDRDLLSIARRNSFQTDAKRPAARGMTQSCLHCKRHRNASEHARVQTGRPLQSDTAFFWTQYLSNLFQQFPNQPQAVAGSYNGGADNLARWIGRARSNEADRYVPEIGFTQTRDYVYKVMANFWTYQRLYDTQLQPVAAATK